MLHLAPVARSGAPDLVLTGGNDGVIRLWDPDTGVQTMSLTGHTDAVLSLSTLDRSRVVSASRDYTLRLWDLDTATMLRATTTADGGRLGTVTAGHRARRPDARGLRWRRLHPAAVGPGRRRQLGRPWTGHFGTVRTVTAVPGPDGSTRIVSGAGDGTLRLWQWDTDGASTVGDPWRGHVGWVRAAVPVRWPDSTTTTVVVVSGGADGTIRLWQARSGTPVADPWRSGSGVIAVATGRGPDGRLVTSYACEDTTVRRWDPVEREEIGRAQIAHPVHAVDVVNGVTTLATD